MPQEPMTYIKTILANSLFDHLSLKALGSILFAIGTFLFSGLSKDALAGLLILIVVDFAVAVIHAKREGKLIDSKKAYKTPIKILVYYTLIACGHIVEFGLPHQISFVDDTMLTFLLITEFLSIARHFSNLGYKTPTNLINNMRKIQSEE